MKKLLTILFAGAFLAACNPTETPEGEDFVFDTPTATAVSDTEATLSVSVSSGASAIRTFAIAFQYGEESDALTSYIRVSDVQIDGNTATAHLTGLQPETHYRFYAVADYQTLHRESPMADFTTRAAGFVTPVFGTPTYSGVTQTAATISADFTYAGTQTIDAVYFTYEDAAGTELTFDLTPEQGTKIAALTDLTPLTAYTFRLCVEIGGETYSSEVGAFTTLDNGGGGTTYRAGWPELPATTEGGSLLTRTFYVNGSTRNYTMLYDKATYTAYWVAYPLVKSYVGSGYDGKWQPTPDIDVEDQINIWTHSYGVRYGETVGDPNIGSYPDIYARGHQIPNGDRNGRSDMVAQTYYATNSTPQIQLNFNSGIWSSLEGGIRGTIPASDTLYIVTGAILNKVGESKPVTIIHPRDDLNKNCPLPNYYYKVVLKVRRDADKKITSASTIGFWLEHRKYFDDSYTNYAVSVATIEQYTGFDFFANLPADIAATAEQNSSFSTFSSF